MKPSNPSRYEIVTTITPWRERRSPSKDGSIPPSPRKDPPVFPPPWNHTITGLADRLGHSGDQTFRYRQSSLPVFAATVFQFASICAQGAAYLRASRGPLQGFGGTGSRQRISPTGGCAKGIALNTAPPALSASPAT